MRKSGLILIIFMLILSQVGGLPVYAATDGDYEYDVHSDGVSVTITGYTGAGGNIVIPDLLGGSPVREIAAEAFKGKGLTSVVIPQSVREIRNGAFKDNQLTSVTIPQLVFVVGASAFEGNQLSEVTFEGAVIPLLQLQPTTFSNQSKPSADFDGWFLEPEFNNPWSFTLPAQSPGVTIYAKWTPRAAGPATYHVKEDGNNNNDGLSWATAFDSVQAALDAAKPGDKIWIAKGTYYPTKTIGSDPKSATFQMKNGVEIYGGFAGDNDSETVGSRNWQANETVLSGDIGTKGVSSDNAYHVFYHPSGTNLNSTAVLDGVSIVGGNATFSFNDRGGGMYNRDSHPVLRNVTLSGNVANFGGGMFNINSNPELINVILSGNTAVNNAMGGGMYNEGSRPVLRNVTLSGNTAKWGGGMYNTLSSSPNLTNVTLSGNKAIMGGGMYNIGNSHLIISKSIIWGNTDSIYNESGSQPTFTNSIIEGSGGSAAWDISFGTDNGGNGGNLDKDPRFVAPKQSSDAPTQEGDYRLLPLSPAIPKMMGALGVYALAIDEVEVLPDIAVQNGTAQGAIGLPSQVDVTDQVVTTPLAVVWDTGTPNFDGNTSGSYVFTGTLTLPSYVTNPNSLVAQVNVVVGSGGTSTIHYVKENRGGSKDGLSWATAFDSVQAALDVAKPGDKIWIAKGTYYPTKTIGSDPKSATFQMKNGVAIYGGFAGISDSETVGSRDWKANETILSGDIGTKGVSGDNAYHVFYHSSGTNLNNTAVLDGVSIVGGNATSFLNYRGGGMYNDGSHPVLRNVTLSGNTANWGGGMYNGNSNPELTNVILSGNTAVDGAMGGGMYNQDSRPVLTNVTLSGNKAIMGGGMFNTQSSRPNLTNVTLSGNKAIMGGGMYNIGNSHLIINKSIIWGNTDSIYNESGSQSTFTNSIIEGSGGSAAWVASFGTNNGGNLDTDPRFVAPKKSSDAPTKEGDYRLLPLSPAIPSNASPTKPNLMGALGVYLLEIAKTEVLTDISVPVGTAQAAIGLPSKVDVTDGVVTIPLNVVWDTGAPTYNGNIPSSYSFTGTLTLPYKYFITQTVSVPYYVTNGKGSTAKVNVNVVGGTPVTKHTLNFNADGVEVGREDVVEGEKATKPPVPTKAEHTFVGWYKDAGTLVNEWDFGVDIVTEPTTLYAKWTPFTYRDDPSGGPGVEITGYASTAPKAVVIPAMLGGKPVTAIGVEAFKDKALQSVIIPSGVTRIGREAFYLNELENVAIPSSVVTIGNAAFSRNKLIEIVIPIGVTIISNRAFSENELTRVEIPSGVTTIESAAFAFNKLEVVTIPGSVNLIETYGFLDNKLRKVIFEGAVSTIEVETFRCQNKQSSGEQCTNNVTNWYIDQDVNKPWTETDNVSKAMTIYTNWVVTPPPSGGGGSVPTYTLTFDSTGGSVVDAQTIVDNETAEKPVAPTRAGYTFAGWYMATDFEKEWDFKTGIIEDTILYAKWTQNNYTLIFDANGGSAVKSQQLTYNEAAVNPVAPTKADYTFAGWYKEANFTTKWDFKAGVIADMTLYAKWTMNPPSSDGGGSSNSSNEDNYSTDHMLTFNANSGSTIVSQTVGSNEKATQPATPIKDGYTFAGWYKEATFITKWDFAVDVVTRDTTLYAKWTENAIQLPEEEPVQEEVVEEPTSEETPTPVCTANFTDTSSHWAKEEIDAITCRDIIKGYPDGAFKPNEAITREHVALMFTRAFELTPTRSAIKFSDVPTNYRYYDAINDVYQAGIFDGTPNGNFNPSASMTRAQMAKVLVLAFELEPSKTSANAFQDVPSSHWAKDYIAILADNGIALGDNGNFKPEDPVTRAQFVAFMYRALNL